MIVKVGLFSDGKKEFSSLIINNIQVAQKAVKDIIGNTCVNLNLSPHPLYASPKDIKEGYFIDFNTARTVFKNICSDMYDKEEIIMNINGGYIRSSNSHWELKKEKIFKLSGNYNLLDLLKKENKVLGEYKEIQPE